MAEPGAFLREDDAKVIMNVGLDKQSRMRTERLGQMKRFAVMRLMSVFAGTAVGTDLGPELIVAPPDIEHGCTAASEEPGYAVAFDPNNTWCDQPACS